MKLLLLSDFGSYRWQRGWVSFALTFTSIVSRFMWFLSPFLFVSERNHRICFGTDFSSWRRTWTSFNRLNDPFFLLYSLFLLSDETVLNSIFLLLDLGSCRIFWRYLSTAYRHPYLYFPDYPGSLFDVQSSMLFTYP